MSDIKLLGRANTLAAIYYKLEIDFYEAWREDHGSTMWDGAAVAREQAGALERYTSIFPESLALQARRSAIDQFIEAHLGAEFDDTTHEDEMRRLRP